MVWKVVEKKLGYVFSNTALLKQALSHRSYDKENNERLEFLGDSILNFLIAEFLYQRFPEAPEGALSRLRASIVKGESLAKVAIHLDIGPHLLLGVGEMKSGGEARISILADTVEALLAAIYLDSDMDICRERIADWFTTELANVSADNLQKDPKSQLQEWLQERKIALPQYELIETTGKEHAQMFVVECLVEALKKATTGKSSSRRKAEQVAANNMLMELQESI